MKTQPHHPFNADRPIEKIEDDLLGRAEIARSIATAFNNWKGQDALVMALYGGWGDGKSSLKGMVVDALKKEASECPFIVAFNPWEWTNSQQLARAFFDEIANQIASQGIGTKRVQLQRSHIAKHGQVAKNAPGSDCGAFLEHLPDFWKHSQGLSATRRQKTIHIFPSLFAAQPLNFSLSDT